MAGAKLRHLLGIVAVATVLIFLPLPRSIHDMSEPERAVRKATAYCTYESGGEEYIVAAAPMAFMELHQLQRIDGWLRQGDPDIVRGKGYHLYRSKIVLGSGKVLGRGDWDKAEIYFRTLPDDHTDFIFSIIGGQWGFAGCLFVLILYCAIVIFGVEIAATTHDPFGRLLAVGVIGLLVSQVFINVGMTMGLLPITGMTLPFVSYGGSSLVVNCAAVGLLVNVGQNRPVMFSRRPFEYGEETGPVPYGPVESSLRKKAKGGK
jgi:cell division protein FtsW (lipid II flippase)